MMVLVVSFSHLNPFNSELLSLICVTLSISLSISRYIRKHVAMMSVTQYPSISSLNSRVACPVQLQYCNLSISHSDKQQWVGIIGIFPVLMLASYLFSKFWFWYQAKYLLISEFVEYLTKYSKPTFDTFDTFWYLSNSSRYSKREI